MMSLRGFLRACGASSLAAGLFLCWSVGAADRPAGDTLNVMTYNLRFASPRGPNAWPDRRPIMKQVIEQSAPDVFGTQEGVYQQLKDLGNDLPAFEWIGLGREGGSKSEFMAVFYRKSRLEPVAFDHFWLSDTPEVIASSTWKNSNKRMVTWVQFRDLKTHREFYLVNTHFDHQVQEARVRSAELLRKRVQHLNASLPIILTGDFNCTTNNPAYQILTGDGYFKDTWYAAAERRGEGLGTFNGFKAVAKNDSRIDWILTRGPVEVLETEIVTRGQEKEFASDHLPLTARVRLGPPL